MERNQKIFCATAGAVAVAGAGALLYGAKIEPERITITRPTLKKATPVKTVFFTDAHIGKMYPARHLTKIVDTINAETPELVLFGGDFFASFLKDLPYLPYNELKAELSRIEASLGKYAVMGNHELRHGCAPFFKLLFEESGFVVLQDEIVYPRPDIAVCGLTPHPDGRILRQMPANGWRVALCHMPDKCQYLPLSQTDLVLAGHTHNGQVRLPFITNMVLPVGGRVYPYGSYQPHGDQSAQLFVSRGLGMSGVPFRFMAPPEIVVLEPAP